MEPEISEGWWRVPWHSPEGIWRRKHRVHGCIWYYLIVFIYSYKNIEMIKYEIKFLYCIDVLFSVFILKVNHFPVYEVKCVTQWEWFQFNETVGETALGPPSACRRICHEKTRSTQSWDGHLNAGMYVNFARVRLFWTFNTSWTTNIDSPGGSQQSQSLAVLPVWFKERSPWFQRIWSLRKHFLYCKR